MGATMPASDKRQSLPPQFGCTLCISICLCYLNSHLIQRIGKKRNRKKPSDKPWLGSHWAISGRTMAWMECRTRKWWIRDLRVRLGLIVGDQCNIGLVRTAGTSAAMAYVQQSIICSLVWRELFSAETVWVRWNEWRCLPFVCHSFAIEFCVCTHEWQCGWCIGTENRIAREPCNRWGIDGFHNRCNGCERHPKADTQMQSVHRNDTLRNSGSLQPWIEARVDRPASGTPCDGCSSCGGEPSPATTATCPTVIPHQRTVQLA